MNIPRGLRLSSENKVASKDNKKSTSSASMRKVNAPIEKLVAIALKEVGVREQGGNNCGPRIREYQAATWLEPDAWPWCAAFLCWCIREWLKDPSVVKSLALKDSNLWRPRTAGAFDLIRWGRENNLKILTDIEKAQAGDLVVFDFSHCGLIYKDQESVYIETIEGNTNGHGDRDSIVGDGVWKKTRHVGTVKAFIRLV